MAFLGSFEYDIFLSYGWAGNRTPEEGDRAWIRAFKDLLVERLRTQLGRAPTIFLDSQAERSGALGEALESAVESSAFLLFAMSPGSCRPDSWCQADYNQHDNPPTTFGRAVRFVHCGHEWGMVSERCSWQIHALHAIGINE